MKKGGYTYLFNEKVRIWASTEMEIITENQCLYFALFIYSFVIQRDV